MGLGSGIWDLGSGIWDPEKTYSGSQIPDGSRGQKGTGSRIRNTAFSQNIDSSVPVPWHFETDPYTGLRIRIQIWIRSRILIFSSVDFKMLTENKKPFLRSFCGYIYRYLNLQSHKTVETQVFSIFLHVNRGIRIRTSKYGSGSWRPKTYGSGTLTDKVSRIRDWWKWKSTAKQTRF
jgi:hypothetical protein